MPTLALRRVLNDGIGRVVGAMGKPNPSARRASCRDLLGCRDVVVEELDPGRCASGGAPRRPLWSPLLDRVAAHVAFVRDGAG